MFDSFLFSGSRPALIFLPGGPLHTYLWHGGTSFGASAAPLDTCTDVAVNWAIRPGSIRMAWLKPVARGNLRAWGAQVAYRNSLSVVALRGVLKFSSVQFNEPYFFDITTCSLAGCIYRRRCELGHPAWLNPVAWGNICAWGAQVARRNLHSVVALRGVLKFSSVQFNQPSDPCIVSFIETRV